MSNDDFRSANVDGKTPVFTIFLNGGHILHAARVPPLPPIQSHGASAAPREVDTDDVDSRAEDHVGDETRYRLLTKEHMTVTRQI